MTTDKCPTCGEWLSGYLRGHRCPPCWLVWDPDQGETLDDASSVYATDAQAAAEQYQERSEADACEYTCVSGGEVALHVMPDKLASIEDVQVFIVTGESVPSYSASAFQRDGRRTPYRVARVRKVDTFWVLQLEDLTGEDAGTFRFPHADTRAPEGGSYVFVDGEVGPSSALHWRERRVQCGVALSPADQEAGS